MLSVSLTFWIFGLLKSTSFHSQPQRPRAHRQVDYGIKKDITIHKDIKEEGTSYCTPSFHGGLWNQLLLSMLHMQSILWEVGGKYCKHVVMHCTKLLMSTMSGCGTTSLYASSLDWLSKSVHDTKYHNQRRQFIRPIMILLYTYT